LNFFGFFQSNQNQNVIKAQTKNDNNIQAQKPNEAIPKNIIHMAKDIIFIAMASQKIKAKTDVPIDSQYSPSSLLKTGPSIASV
jgi:hypothetical protein